MVVAVQDAPSDAELARAVMGAGSPVAEAELCRRFGRRVLAYGRRHLGDEPRARDLSQRVLLLTIEKLRAKEVREPERIASFVLGVARTLAREIARGDERESTGLPDEAEMPSLVPEPEPLAADRLGRCLEHLSARERTVVVLTYFSDHNATEIGTALALQPGNVRVIRHRAIDRLRDCMGLAEVSA